MAAIYRYFTRGPGLEHRRGPDSTNEVLEVIHIVTNHHFRAMHVFCRLSSAGHTGFQHGPTECQIAEFVKIILRAINSLVGYRYVSTPLLALAFALALGTPHAWSRCHLPCSRDCVFEHDPAQPMPERIQKYALS